MRTKLKKKKRQQTEYKARSKRVKTSKYIQNWMPNEAFWPLEKWVQHELMHTKWAHKQMNYKYRLSTTQNNLKIYFHFSKIQF